MASRNCFCGAKATYYGCQAGDRCPKEMLGGGSWDRLATRLMNEPDLAAQHPRLAATLKVPAPADPARSWPEPSGGVGGAALHSGW